MAGPGLLGRISRGRFRERIPESKIVLLLGIILHALDPDSIAVVVQMADLVVGIIQLQIIIFSLERFRDLDIMRSMLLTGLFQKLIVIIQLILVSRPFLFFRKVFCRDKELP